MFYEFHIIFVQLTDHLTNDVFIALNLEMHTINI